MKGSVLDGGLPLDRPALGILVVNRYTIRYRCIRRYPVNYRTVHFLAQKQFAFLVEVRGLALEHDVPLLVVLDLHCLVAGHDLVSTRRIGWAPGNMWAVIFFKEVLTTIFPPFFLALICDSKPLWIFARPKSAVLASK